MIPTLALALLASAPVARPLDRLAALVNDDPVTLSELEEYAGDEYQRAQAMPPGEARERARAKVLQSAFDLFVADALLDKQVEALQLSLGAEEVTSAIEEIKHRNNLTDEQLDGELTFRGKSRDAFRKEIKKQLEVGRILSLKVRNRIKISDEDLRAFYQRNLKTFKKDEEARVRHVFLALAPGAGAAEEAAVRARIEKVVARLRGGEDFAKVARELSEGPSAAEGGDLGTVKRGTLQGDLDRVAFSLTPGQVSDPVRSGPGLHVLKVEARQSGETRSFDDAKEEIRDRLTNEQVETFRDSYVAELRRDATIEVRIPELAAK